MVVMEQQPSDAKAQLLEAFFAQRSALISTVTPIVGCRYWAEDVVQDSFVKITQMSVPSDLRKPESYLHRLVRNLAMDKIRRLTLEKQYHTTEEAGTNEPSPDASPEKKMSDISELQTVASALDELPERTRRAFEMHRLHGMTQKQIADELGVSPTLVNFMIRDALTLCRKRLLESAAPGFNTHSRK